MNKSIFSWVKNIKCGAHRPTTSCEFISSGNVISAIITVEIARNCQFSHGLAKRRITYDYHGHIVICAIKPVNIQCT
ncbi:hypothetical protein LMH66_04195 [Shewanella sp. 10N.7]|uniref:hypothetical protein n=1 Tax=Shewanella sp. 10N.7 TaxID=2885093 RepID=UPI001E30AE8E|nr:hypothetical protein [Shewanella sp. 10N.7]MCC4831827.1 hypothetical protein [Shewanella sp. 10N.7]